MVLEMQTFKIQCRNNFLLEETVLTKTNCMITLQKVLSTHDVLIKAFPNEFPPLEAVDLLKWRNYVLVICMWVPSGR